MSAPDTPDLFKSMPEEGSIFAAQFQLIKKIAEGASGTVYLAQHIFMGRQVLRPDSLLDDRAARRFLNESKTISRLKHQHAEKTESIKAQSSGYYQKVV